MSEETVEMVQGKVGYRKSGHCGIIDIVAPDRKLSGPMAADLVDLCGKIVWDEDIRVVVVSFDGDLRPQDDEGPGEQEAGCSAAVLAMAGLTVPVVAAIKGDGLDLGLELALACDIRVGAQGSRFGFPGIGGGVMPSAGGTQRLPRLVGRGRAMDMVLTGDPMDADEALRTGLVNRLAPLMDVQGLAMTLAEGMAAKSPPALGYVKEALHQSQDLTLDQGLRMELDLYLLLFTTGDRVEGITAFKEKRKPVFKGE